MDIATIDYAAIGDRIRATRLKRKITQEALSAATNLSIAHISHIECGKTKLSLPALVSIATTLGVTVDNLLYDNDSAPYGSYDKEFAELISDCTGQERRTILESAVQVKKALRKKV